MADTPNLALPLLAAGQAQKHVTHNESLALLDALVHLAVTRRGAQAPPDRPADGERVLVGAGASGAFAGHDGEVACFDAGAWRFLVPRAGWWLYVAEEHRMFVHDGTDWRDDPAANSGVLQKLVRLGIGTEADAANPFAARLAGALFTAVPSAEGGSGDLRLVLNREGPGNVLSLLLQSAWAGRAEIGLSGDDLVVKTSPDGTTWHEALRLHAADGTVAAPRNPCFAATVNYRANIGVGLTATVPFNEASHNPTGAFSAATNSFRAPVAGRYRIEASLVVVPTSGAGILRLVLAVNGTRRPSGLGYAAPSLRGTETLHARGFLSLAAGDVVTATLETVSTGCAIDPGTGLFAGHLVG